jgi:hypothetical protein
MLRRTVLAVAVVMSGAGPVIGQVLRATESAPAWRPTPDSSVHAVSATAASADELRTAERIGTSSPASSASPTSAETTKNLVARVTVGNGTLPSDAGQVWRDYDISPYTARVTTTKRPEQAIVDWILRDTGYESWHTEPLGILSAGPRTLHVYNTPDMQKVVADVVDRFVSSEAATYTFSLRVVTLDSPNWRTTAQRLLRPVPVQTPGINAWLLAKEDAAILLGELHRRNDYREHSSPYLVVNNGQSTVVSTMRGRPYVRDVILRPDTPVGFDPSPGQVEEGFLLDFSPLLSADRRLVDATIKCDVDQIEKMLPVMIDVPTQAVPRQRTKIDVPQMTHYRFHERFRWPVDDVLLVRMGMVAMPIPVDGAPMVPGVPLPIGNTPARADLLVFVECKGQSTVAAAPGAPAQPARTPQHEAKNYRGRY